MNTQKILKEHHSKRANQIWNSVLKQLPELSPFDQEEILRMAIYWIFDSSHTYNQKYGSFADKKNLVGMEHKLWVKVQESICKLSRFYEKQELPVW